MAVGIGNCNLPVERFVPFQGTVNAGAATGVRKLFFQAHPVSFGYKRNGVC